MTNEASDRKGRPAFGLTSYNPQEMEVAIYDWWVESGFFQAGKDPDKRPYAIVMPPPNVTGVLHLGHALDNALQDLLIRFKRMQGFDVLWLPGTDHAGIATQARVEAQLRQDEGISRHELGREAFVLRVWEWKEQYAQVIRSQIRRLGASCDWSRERFTMDAGLSQAVREVFVSLYERGLIYRGDYIINWCPRCTTALSDIEVQHEDQEGALYHIQYPFAQGEGHLTVATTRPETLLGDVAVAVHPDDERYRTLVGRSLKLPLTDREIPIIADEYVDPAFGTGVVKITPAHDPNDFEVGRRHQLSAINIMTKDGSLNAAAGVYAGLDRFDARKAVVADLEKLGIVHIEKHQHAVGHCERCGTVVEPWLSTQWFVKMQPLAVPAQAVVDRGDVRFVPDRFAKIYTHWLDHVHDWCISRQLWWGHRIPAWFCANCGEMTVARTDPTACAHCGSEQISQEDDVLDTWFSSALWPFSTMGWPEQTSDFNRYFPTQVLVTGPDIIYFWVARMIFMSLQFTDQRPFSDILMHGLVRDDQGRKFSKSLGNGIDPMEICAQYSADALRFMLLTGAAMGQDMRFYLERVEAAQGFVTKLWNAARFVSMNAGEASGVLIPEAQRGLAERYILHRLGETAQTVTAQLEAYQFPEAGKTIYEFFWSDFCDWYIELAKVGLYREGDEAKNSVRQTLLYVMDQALRLLHPFMPFVTEAIWQSLAHDGDTIMQAAWPRDLMLEDAQALNDMSLIMDVIRSVRGLRHELGVTPGKKVGLFLRPTIAREPLLRAHEAMLVRLCNPSEIVIDHALTPPDERVTGVLHEVEIFIPLAGLVDIQAEQARLVKERQDLDFEVERLEKKLNNASFVAKAPAAVVTLEREKLQGYEAMRAKVIAQLEALGTSGQESE
ncbi:MAG: valine--tRNA ligase [Firmicutes bacterium]|nr:valine--tRNA ligase [Bacillota bacterium]